MARSNYIYLVTVSKMPVAAFTVKHELRKYINGREWRVPYVVFRMRDGDSEIPPQPMQPDEVQKRQSAPKKSDWK